MAIALETNMTKEEIEFYQECADIQGVTLDEWFKLNEWGE